MFLFKLPKQSHLCQLVESLHVPFQTFHVFLTGKAPITVHDEGHMFWHRSSLKDTIETRGITYTVYTVYSVCVYIYIYKYMGVYTYIHTYMYLNIVTVYMKALINKDIFHLSNTTLQICEV